MNLETEDVRERLREVGEKQLGMERDRRELQGEMRDVKGMLGEVEREIGEWRGRQRQGKEELKAALEALECKEWEESSREKAYQSSFSDLYAVHQAQIAQLQSSISSQQQQLVSYQLHAADISRQLLQIRLSRPSPTPTSTPLIWTMTFSLISGFLASSLFFLPL